MTSAGDREAAMSRLPTTYARALRLREAGLPDESIAEQLGIDLTAVRPLMTLAEAKLATILRDQAASTEDE